MMLWLRAYWIWVLAGLVALAASFGAGRYSAPTKIEVRTVTEWKERIVEKEVEKIVRVEGPVRIKRVIVERPVPGSCDTAGPVQMETVTTEEEERGPVTTTTDETHDRELEALGVTATEKIVTRDAPRLTLLFTFGTSVTSPAPVYGGEVVYRVLGPLTLGAGFDSSLRATVAAGLTF